MAARIWTPSWGLNATNIRGPQGTFNTRAATGGRPYELSMIYDPDIHHRRSTRLRGYDYASLGAYFVTICAQDRACLFGGIVDGEMYPNDAGLMVTRVWNEVPANYAGVDVDAHAIMPNHFHGIIILTVGAGPRACPGFTARACTEQGRPQEAAPTAKSETGPCNPQGGAPTLFDVVQRFKSLTTAKYRHGVVDCNWPPFSARLWQRGYYERIIRDDEELNAIREYIRNNPLKWAEDEENPANKPGG